MVSVGPAVAAVAASTWASSSERISSSERAARSSSLPTEALRRSRSVSRSRPGPPGRNEPLGSLSRLRRLPVPQDRPAVDAQRARERLDGREEPLLESRDEEHRLRPACASSRSRAAARAGARYWSSSAERRSSGASAGRPSMSTWTTLRLGKPPEISRMSSFRRRTMTSSRSFASTGTPRQNRCGSRISSSAEKLFEWPLCGVAERKSRCSKRGARSRTARVIFESIA